MRLFARKKSKAVIGSDEVAQRLANSITTKQRALADYLNGKARHLTPGFWKYAIVGFCIAFGSYCLYLIIGAAS